LFEEGVAGHILAAFLDHALRERLWRLRLMPTKIIKPGTEMRVSFSALLRIAESDSYLLIRSLHRRESFGPFGGVYKYLSGAVPRLDELQFRPQVVSPDMRDDLRGFLPRRRLLSLLRWFDEGTEREDAGACLRREPQEELKEVHLSKQISLPEIPHFRRIRRVSEGPAIAAGQSYTQYRIFDVYEVTEPNKDVARFLKELRSLATNDKHLLLACSHEIIAGRSHDGRYIGHHSGYVFRRQRVRPDEPMFVEATGGAD